MYTKKRLMAAASIALYVFTVLWMLAAAAFFSVGEGIYGLFVVLALVSLYDGILITAVRENMTSLRLSGGERNKYLLYTVVSVVSPVALVLNIIALVWNREDSFEIVAKPVPERQKSREKKPVFKTANFIVLVVAFCLVLTSGVSGMLFETSGLSVQVSDFQLTKEMTDRVNTLTQIQNDTLHYGVSMYVPQNATAQTPASTVIVMPGFTRTKATMSQYAIELSRRGFVVFVLDPNEQGASGYAGFTTDEAGNQTPLGYTTGANGLQYLVDYIYNNTADFPFVDRNNIGLVGHSAGGGNVATTASFFNNQADARDYQSSWIKSVYISGYIKTSAATEFRNLYCNAAMSYAYYDEGSFRYQSDTTALEVISLRFLNELNGSAVYNEYDEYALDYGYGSMEEGTYRIIHRENTNHCFEMYDAESIANTVRFFQDTLHMDSDIPLDSQIWFGKEFSTLFGLVGGFLFIISLSGLLIENTRLFGLARGKEIVNGAYTDEPVIPEKKKRGTYDRILFWTTFIVTAVIACLDYIPLAYLSIQWLPDAAANKFVFLFPARMINAILFWATTNGLIGLGIFFGTLSIENLIRKSKGEKPDWSKLKPLRIDAKGFGVTLLLAVILFAVFYLLIQMNYILFHQDFRFLLISAAPLSLRFVLTWLEYFPVIFIFYIANSIRVNCGIGNEGWSEGKVMLVGALGNSVGLMFILVINYFSFFSTGAPFYGYFGNPAEEVWLYINMVFALTPMMFILPIFNRLFYRQTNRAWLGPIVTSMIFVMMTLAASISFIPVP